MPTYFFRKNDGSLHQEFMGVAEMMARTIDGRLVLESGEVVVRDIVAEHQDVAHRPGNWPMKSDALGCGVSQIDEARAESVALGVPTDFDPEGRAILTSAKHRKMYAEATGHFDRNGGYSDPRRKH